MAPCETFFRAANLRTMSLQEEARLAPAISFICERCQGVTMLASVEPHPTHGARIEVHTFECLECGHRDAFSRQAAPRGKH
jgi:hypothetical protein